jgi:hypothetical protein
MTTPLEPSVFQAEESLRDLLVGEAAATRKYLEYKKAADSWEDYRRGIRKQIAAATGNAPIVKIGDEVVLTYALKGQFSGTRFAAEYPALAAEFTRVQAKEYLDTDALRAEHPDIADQFTVRTFVNKAA